VNLNRANYLTQVTEGIAAYIATSYPANYAWKDQGKYGAGTVGIYVDVTPELKSPSLTLTAYMMDDDTDTVMVQFKMLALDTRDVNAIEGDVWNLFQERWGGTLGDMRLSLASRASGTTLGQDAQGRQGRTENYAFIVYRPTPNRSS
jgi:hypothetical protein